MPNFSCISFNFGKSFSVSFSIIIPPYKNKSIETIISAIPIHATPIIINTKHNVSVFDGTNGNFPLLSNKSITVPLIRKMTPITLSRIGKISITISFLLFNLYILYNKILILSIFI